MLPLIPPSDFSEINVFSQQDMTMVEEFELDHLVEHLNIECQESETEVHPMDKVSDRVKPY